MYFHRMRGLARKALFGRARRTCDGDDVAASAFRSVYRGAMAGEFPQLKGRQDLWSLLAAVTSNKCIDRMRREGRAKRGGHSDVVDADELRSVAESGDGPVSVVELADLRERISALLESHGDATLREIVRLRMDGETMGEIARRMGCVRRTVERKLRLVQEICKSELP